MRLVEKGVYLFTLSVHGAVLCSAVTDSEAGFTHYWTKTFLTGFSLRAEVKSSENINTKNTYPKHVCDHKHISYNINGGVKVEVGSASVQ